MGQIGLALVEGGIVFGGTLALCLWQLRVLKRDREALARKKAEAAAAEAATKASAASETATSA